MEPSSVHLRHSQLTQSGWMQGVQQAAQARDVWHGTALPLANTCLREDPVGRRAVFAAAPIPGSLPPGAINPAVCRMLSRPWCCAVLPTPGEQAPTHLVLAAMWSLLFVFS